MKAMLEFITRGAKTKRYHTTDTLTSQTVGEHSFGVAMLVYMLAARKPSWYLMMTALTHDLAEHVVGDVSSPTKRRFPELKRCVDHAEEIELAKFHLNYEHLLEKDEHRIFKLADNLDGMLFCVREKRFGNKAISEVWLNYTSYVSKLQPFSDDEEQIIKAITQLWGEAR